MSQDPQNYTKEYISFLGKKIMDSEIMSMLPFFDCEEIGHTNNALDQICLNEDCKFKGLCCVRCQYQKHRSHLNCVFPLNIFVSQLVSTLSKRNQILEEQKQKCSQYRDMVISILKDYLNDVIEHMSIIVASLHKYYSIFENSFETTVIKSHIITHSLIYKKHIPKDKFQRFIRESIKSVQFTQQQSNQQSNDYYILDAKQIAINDHFSCKSSKLQNPLIQENRDFTIKEQEKAYEMTQEYLNEMQLVAKKFSQILKSSQLSLQAEIDLNRLCARIPTFESDQLKESIGQFKKQFQFDASFSIFKGIQPNTNNKMNQF